MASVRKRGKGYQITISNGRDLNGKQILETTTFIPDPNKTPVQQKKELEVFVVTFEQKVKDGKYLDGEKITFKEFVDKWMADYAESQFELATLAQYKKLLEFHLFPALGNMKMSKIQPPQLNKLYNSMAKSRKDGKDGGYAAKTIRHVHTLASSIFTSAVKWNVLMDNPCARSSPPRQSGNDKIKFFTLEQSLAFLQAVNEPYTVTIKAHNRVNDTGKPYHVNEYTETRCLPTQYRLFFQMALFCGMRRGELIALTWDDIDLINRTINITKSTGLVDGKCITKAPKTAGSVRLISLPPLVVDLAAEYKKEQDILRDEMGTAWHGDNFVFIQTDGKQMYPSTPYKVFKEVIKRYNTTADPGQELPDIPLHGLRHTSATLLISQKTDIRTVSGRLGHSKTSTTTDIYGHFLQKADEGAADSLAEILLSKK